MTAALAYQLLTDLPKGVLEELDESPDITRAQAVMVLQAARDCRRELATIEHDLEMVIVELSGKERSFVVEGVGAVEVKKKTDRVKWDNHALFRLVVALALDERIADEKTGEYEPAHEAVARVLEECARPSWRLTPLRARHIPIDEYSEKEDAGWGVRIS